MRRTCTSCRQPLCQHTAVSDPCLCRVLVCLHRELIPFWWSISRCPAPRPLQDPGGATTASTADTCVPGGGHEMHAYAAQGPFQWCSYLRDRSAVPGICKRSVGRGPHDARPTQKLGLCRSVRGSGPTSSKKKIVSGGTFHHYRPNNSGCMQNTAVQVDAAAGGAVQPRRAAARRLAAARLRHAAARRRAAHATHSVPSARPPAGAVCRRGPPSPAHGHPPPAGPAGERRVLQLCGRQERCWGAPGGGRTARAARCGGE